MRMLAPLHIAAGPSPPGTACACAAYAPGIAAYLRMAVLSMPRRGAAYARAAYARAAYARAAYAPAARSLGWSGHIHTDTDTHIVRAHA
jgi:hypothetical protein